ncbi:DUF4136 domain-containing protein [Hyalangium versicolor]|uniref:DUF4136 domain-containing protein n=1 Tax=Hyalangium versicolor TaxID=2861190 RepID=UPI001CCDC78C|nr:DUF4136 domain-containing protein [Hyalangium versicolor]
MHRKQGFTPYRASRRWSCLTALLAGLALGLGACASGPAVRTDYEATADFSSFHTFTIRPGRLVSEASVSDPAAQSTARQRIEDAIRHELTAKGLTEVEDSPDLYVTYVAGARTRQEWENLGPSMYSDYGFLWGPSMWAPGYDDWWIERDVTQGSLVIDLIDAKTRKAVWRTFAEEDIQRPVSEKTVQTAVGKALEDYPPKARQ